MSAHRLNQDLSANPDVVPDPAVGNTTTGSGQLPNNFDCIIRLVASQAVTQEQRTLGDPSNAGILLTLMLYSTAGANLRVTSVAKINTAGNTHILFTAADQVVQLFSVPIAPTGGASPPKYRWEVSLNDGTSLS